MIRLLIGMIQFWALCGGVLLLTVVLMTTFSAVAGYLVASPFSGDFELTEMGVAIAVFSFLPYCQITAANVSADFFSSGASQSLLRLLHRFGSLIALCFSILLLWRMSVGVVDYRSYLETTTILQIPLWYAFLPALFSLVLLAGASFLTMLRPETAKLVLRGVE